MTADILGRLRNRIHDAPMPTEHLLDEAADAITEARDAFRNYARHTSKCNMGCYRPSTGIKVSACDCGFSAALAKMDTPEPMPDGEH